MLGSPHPQNWNEDMFAFLKGAGAKAYSNYAVGFNNVDVAGATKNGIPVGNTPGVLTEVGQMGSDWSSCDTTRVAVSPLGYPLRRHPPT